MKIVKFTFNMFGENCYLVYNSDSREAMIVDPGMLTEAERQVIDGFIADNKLRVKHIVNTHMHLDHCFGAIYAAQKYGIDLLAHPSDSPLGQNLTGQAAQFGIFDDHIADISTTKPLNDGDTLTLGNETVKVIHTPGHSPGGLSLYAPSDGWVITGDTLFAGGNIGRTDLPGGDYDTLINSIRTKLFTLPGDTTVLPGHGPASTIAQCK